MNAKPAPIKPTTANRTQRTFGDARPAWRREAYPLGNPRAVRNADIDAWARHAGGANGFGDGATA